MYMNETMKPKRAYLDSANGASTILTLLAAMAAVPGVIRLYNFMIDAQDQKIEVATLLGLGDRTIPGLDQGAGSLERRVPGWLAASGDAHDRRQP